MPEAIRHPITKNLFSKGIYRSGTWLLDFNGDRIDETAAPNSGDRMYPFGGFPGDVPVAGDWNGLVRDL